MTGERRLQAEEAIQGCLYHGLYLSVVDDKVQEDVWKLRLLGRNGKATARVPANKGELPDDYFLSIRVAPRVDKARRSSSSQAGQLRSFHTGEHIAVWRDLINDTRRGCRAR